MENYRECVFKDIYLEESSISNIFVSGNNIYVLGNIDTEHPVVKAEIEALSQEMFDSGRELVNVVYSTDMGVYNVYKEGSEAEQLLKDITETDFSNLELGKPELPNFDEEKTVEDYLPQ